MGKNDTSSNTLGPPKSYHTRMVGSFIDFSAPQQATGIGLRLSWAF